MIIETDLANLEYVPLDKNIIYYRKKSTIEQDRKIVDLFPYCWAVAIGKSTGNISLSTQGIEHSFSGHNLVFLPINCLVEWTLKKQDLYFQAFLCKSPMPTDFPSEPMYVKFDNIDEKFKSVIEKLESCSQVNDFDGADWEQWLKQLVYNMELQNQSLDQSPEASLSLPLRTKNQIDKTFNQDLSIAEVAKELKVSHSYLVRQFKKHYKITPVEYRKRYRVYYMMYKLLFEKAKVIEAGADAGFNDLSHIYTYFRDILGVMPKKFKAE